MGSKTKSKKHSRVERLEQEDYDTFLETSIRKRQEEEQDEVVYEHWTKSRDKTIEKEVQKEKENDSKLAMFKKPIEPLAPSRSYLRKKDDKETQQNKTEGS